MIVAYIDSHRERFGVEPICAELSQHGITIAPSTYHAHKALPVSAAALEALRRTVGDATFYAILREWVDRYRGQNVTTEDFIALSEELSGQQLDAFFQTWLYEW